jgi:cell division protein FtsB
MSFSKHIRNISHGHVRWSFYAQRRRLATFAAAALAVGVGYHVMFGRNGLTVYEQKRQETQVLERQLKDLTQENDRLESHVERLQSDPNAIERQARAELHYTRPGEVIVTLPPDHFSEMAKNKGVAKQ